MGILSKNTIETWILPHLPIGKRGFETTVALEEIVLAILYRLKTGCQWRELPTKELFSDKILTWNSVFYYFNKWSKLGCWKNIWINLLKNNLKYLDLSSVQFDGSHTLAKNGGDGVGYQNRKAGETTNTLFVSDNQGVMLGFSTPQEGNHHDLYQIKELFEQICSLLKEAGICLDGLFLNADSGFDSDEFRLACQKEEIIPNVKPNPRNSKPGNEPVYQKGDHVFDDLLYKDRAVIEHANAWMDGFKALLVRFEFSLKNWISLNFITISVIFLRKISKNKKV